MKTRGCGGRWPTRRSLTGYLREAAEGNFPGPTPWRRAVTQTAAGVGGPEGVGPVRCWASPGSIRRDRARVPDERRLGPLSVGQRMGLGQVTATDGVSLHCRVPGAGRPGHKRADPCGCRLWRGEHTRQHPGDRGGLAHQGRQLCPTVSQRLLDCPQVFPAHPGVDKRPRTPTGLRRHGLAATGYPTAVHLARQPMGERLRRGLQRQAAVTGHQAAQIFRTPRQHKPPHKNRGRSAVLLPSSAAGENRPPSAARAARSLHQRCSGS